MARNILGLAKSMRQLKRIPSQIVTAVAPRLNALIQQGFSQGTDPYGIAWAPLKPATLAKGRTPPPLTEFGALRGSAVLTPASGAGLILGTPPFYGPIHMAGTDDMAKRRYFPDAGLPSAWRAVIADEYRQQFSKVLKS